MGDDSRLSAIRDLLDDEAARENRASWEAILDDEHLIPETQNAIFQKEFYAILIKEMEDGYLRKDKIRREKRKRTGRSSGYIPPQMRINSSIGRFLFAYFKWHDFTAIAPKTDIKPHILEDIAEAFEFRIDPAENQRQFLTPETRAAVIETEKNSEYNKWLWKIIIFAFTASFILVLWYLLRQDRF